LDSLVDNKIVNYENHSTEDTVYFKIRMNTAQLSHEKILKDFKLTGSINTTNMHLFDAKGNIKKYRSPREIVKDFVDVRLHHYDVRKKYQLKKMSVDLNILTQKITFIRLIVNEELVIYKKKKDVIMSELKKRKFSMVDGGYDYLLKMELYNLTDEKINELDTAHKKIKLALDTLEKTSIQDIWMQDLA
jgi:DNA topoisomerase-2